MKKIQIGNRLDESTVEELRKRAKAKGVSLNSYIEDVLNAHLKEEGFQSERENEISNVIRIRCKPELKEKLKRRAAEEGMSVRALLNNEDAVEASEPWVHSPQLAAAGPSEYNGTRKDGSHHGGKRIPTCVT